MTVFGRLIPILALLVANQAVAGTIDQFETRFHDETLRVDYFHNGDADTQVVALDQVFRQGIWAGSRTRLIDDLNLGRYYAHLYDAESGEVLYSRGFDSYFGEYQTTQPALEGRWRTYHESVLVPCPRRPCELALSVRNEDLSLREIFRVSLDPEDATVRREPLDEQVIVFPVHESGDPHSRVDLAILGDGYTCRDVGTFMRDVQRVARVMLQQEPFASYADRLNIRGVLKVSQDAGCDEPSRGVFARTPLGCTFDSLGSERYLLTEDNRAVRDIAASVPYDVLSIMVNHERYGGGGIYNSVNTFTNRNQWSDYVFLHEFGHHFAGLADEYYTSQTAYSDFYPRDREPLEPNITILSNPSRLKWRAVATRGLALPTPWEKEAYDTMDTEYQAQRNAINEKIGELMRDGGDPEEIAHLKAEGEQLSRRHQDRADAYLAQSQFAGMVGAFEGAGYCSEGMYRAELDCIMFSKGVKPFCAACRRHLVRVIDSYGE